MKYRDSLDIHMAYFITLQLENMHADYTARQLEASPQSSATISTPQQEQLGSAEVSVELLREMRLNREARERAEEKEKEKAEMEKKRKEAVQEKKKFWSSRGGYGNGKSRRGRGGGGRGGKRDGADGLGFYIRPQ